MSKIPVNKLINMCTVSGITDEGIDNICKELDIPRDKFNDFISGQSCGYVPNKVLYYECDVSKFLRMMKKG
jgi:hypothetical protein